MCVPPKAVDFCRAKKSFSLGAFKESKVGRAFRLGYMLGRLMWVQVKACIKRGHKGMSLAFFAAFF